MLIATVLMLTLMAPPSQAAGSNMKTESKTPPDLNFPEITLCHPEAVIAHYLLDDPPSCEEITAETTQTFEADIFHPQPMLIDIPTAACSIEKIHFASTYYFFGAQTTVKGNPIRTPATANRCSDWKEKKYDPDDVVPSTEKKRKDHPRRRSRHPEGYSDNAGWDEKK